MPAEHFSPWDGTAVILLQAYPLQRLQGGELLPTEGGICSPHPFQELIVIGPDLTGEYFAFTRILRQASLVGSQAVARVPFRRNLLLHPSGSRVAELVEGPMHGLQDIFQPVQGADRRQDVIGIGPLGPTRLHPPPRFAGGQKGIEEPLASLMGQHVTAKIVQ
jgi:hypothetical protein